MRRLELRKARKVRSGRKVRSARKVRKARKVRVGSADGGRVGWVGAILPTLFP